MTTTPTISSQGPILRPGRSPLRRRRRLRGHAAPWVGSVVPAQPRTRLAVWRGSRPSRQRSGRRSSEVSAHREFQRMTAGSSCSQPSADRVAVWSTKRRPSTGSSSHHRAVEDPQDVAVGEHGDVAVGGPRPGDHPVGAAPRRRPRVSPSGAGVGPDRPARHGPADLGGGEALVVAVVELAEVVVDLGPLAVRPASSTGVAGPLQRAGEHQARTAWPASSLPVARACSSPSGSSGRSVRPVWRPFGAPLGGAVADHVADPSGRRRRRRSRLDAPGGLLRPAAVAADERARRTSGPTSPGRRARPAGTRSGSARRSATTRAPSPPGRTASGRPSWLPR